LMLLADIEMSEEKYGAPDNLEIPNVMRWMKAQRTALRDIIKLMKQQGKLQEVKAHLDVHERLGHILTGLEAQPDNFVVVREHRLVRKEMKWYTIIRPIFTPHHLLNQIFYNVSQIVLMSATIFDHQIKEITRQSHYEKFAIKHPVPEGKRPLLIKNANLTAMSSPRMVAHWIQKILTEWEGHKSVIVHVTYSMAEQLREFFPHALTNTSEDKTEVLKQFKETGGLWLASGCAEGIDLPGDVCRLNLIPYLPFANVTDPVVAAKLNKPGGRVGYNMDTVSTLIQQVGRTTRSIDDYSTSILGDIRLAGIVNQHKSLIPAWFTKSIIWR